MYDFVEKEENISALSRWSMQKVSLIQNSIYSGNDQAGRDHEFWVLQLKLGVKNFESEERQKKLELEEKRLEGQMELESDEKMHVQLKEKKVERLTEMERYKFDNESRGPVGSNVSYPWKNSS